MKWILCLVLGFSLANAPHNEPLRLALVKYNGGGDWYSNPTSLVNLAAFCNETLNTQFALDYATVEIGSLEIFNFPILHLTGHGNVVFNTEEAQNLRNYLLAGGFLHIDDNYGMDQYVKVAMKQVFPELDWIELPNEHPIYHQSFDFPKGLPKIHEHDNNPSVGLGLIWEGRVVCYYTHESDLGDGWEDPDVHNDPPDVRLKALQMGANIVEYAFEN